MLGEGPHRVLPAVDRAERQVPGQLLIAPAVQHRGEDLFVGAQQRQAVHQMQACGARHETVVSHQSSTLRHLH
ncbi:hypothetical protein [Nonomuraea sp. NEAU-A123]|uniref:hypothetical protein n=1 Tax=Nonomuraea sp. NEAU-A123 TaxID=2839649 RepID=UPI001BE4854A|nr:hypothetical protein [Nonomuraea sp. NEAU-A123]MBT2233563.1 hypothetical protein [Nonomuraea sp. NEAU-A123]